MQKRTCKIDGCPSKVDARGWCSAHYARWRKYGDPLANIRPTNTACVVDGCDSPPRSRVADWCEAHYMRWYRHGDPSVTSTGKGRFVRRYKTIYRPGHPLSNKHGHAYVHRVVLYGKIGPGPHPCHWCGVELHWRGDPALHVDHLDDVGDNNHPSNVVASCQGCNNARAAANREAHLLSLGWFSHHDTQSRAS